MEFYHNDLSNYVADGQLPLAIWEGAAGEHPDLSFHDHNFSEIAIIVSGNPMHLAGAGECQLEAGDVLVLHPGIIHAYNKASTLAIINVIYDRHKLSAPLLDGWDMPFFHSVFPGEGEITGVRMLHPVLHLEHSSLAKVVSIAHELEKELLHCQAGSQLGAVVRLMELLLAIARSDADHGVEQQHRFRLGEALAFINKNYSEPITIARLSAISNMSLRNFFRLFRQTMGCSPIEYILQVRLRHGAQMLLQGDKSVLDVAMACGFSGCNFFDRQFKKHYHVSPRQYQKEHCGQRGETIPVVRT